MYVCANGIDVVNNFAVIKSVSIKSFHCNYFQRALNSDITHTMQKYCTMQAYFMRWQACYFVDVVC